MAIVVRTPAGAVFYHRPIGSVVGVGSMPDVGASNEEKADNHVVAARKASAAGLHSQAMAHLERAHALTNMPVKQKNIENMTRGIVSTGAKASPAELRLASPTSTAGRTALAKQDKALPDKSFPIPNLAYLRKAIRAKGRAPASKWPALGRLIRKRARELHAENAPGVKGTWAFSNSMYDLAGALPVTGASDGPRMTTMAGSATMAAAAKTGLKAHQVAPYAKLRKKGVPHNTAMKMAARVKTRANQMGTAKYSNEMTLARGSTRQTSSVLPQSIGARGTNVSTGSGSPRTNQSSALLPQSAARRSLGGTGLGSKLVPHSAGSGGPGTSTPATPINTYPERSANSPLVVKGLSTYKKLRSRGVPHDIALNVARRATISGRASMVGKNSGRVVTSGRAARASA